MANVHFDLRNFNEKTPQPIYLRYRLGKTDGLKYPTGLKVLPKHWSKETERVKNVTAIPERQRINEFLNELTQAVDSFRVRTIIRKETITKRDLREFLNEYLAPTNANEKTLLGFLEQYIQAVPEMVNRKTGKKVSRATVQKLNQLKADLIGFQKQYKKQIDFESIDLDFYADFTAWLQKKGLSVNTIGNKVKTLKTVLNNAFDKGLNKHTAYKSARFMAISEDSENIYLSDTDLEQMANLNLSENKRLERVRDLFLLGAFTGLRFSDFTRITAETIENDTIKLHQQKTSGKVVIPLHPIVKSLLKQYGGKPPQSISSQKMNEYLKEIGQQIPTLLERVSKTITKGGKQVTEQYSKWELLSTHTARRSFATNLFKTGFPAQSIMQITGHRTEKAFLKYIKVTQEEHAQRLAEHWKQNNKLKIA